MALFAAPAVGAQAPADTAVKPVEATRAQLESLAAADEQQAAKTSDSDEREQKRAEAAAIRQRLRDGDFQEGDRIMLSVRGDSTLSDTVVVRAGRVIHLPDMQDISLQGVLRSELQSYLTTQLSKYIKQPEVRATSLVRLSIMGPVGHPGFYQFPADMSINDVIMSAGGPSGGADVNKTEVKRGTKTLYSKNAMRDAITSGRTIDQLSLQPGDEIRVGSQRHFNWLTIAQIAGITVGLLTTFAVIKHH